MCWLPNRWQWHVPVIIWGMGINWGGLNLVYQRQPSTSCLEIYIACWLALFAQTIRINYLQKGVNNQTFKHHLQNLGAELYENIYRSRPPKNEWYDHSLLLPVSPNGIPGIAGIAVGHNIVVGLDSYYNSIVNGVLFSSCSFRKVSSWTESVVASFVASAS